MDLEQGGVGDGVVAAAMAPTVEAEAESAAAAAGSGMGDLVMLREKEQVQRLALLLRNNEEEVMKRLTIKSEQERVQYLKSVNDCYHHSVRLLDDSTALRDTYAAASSGGAAAATRALVARDVHDYVTYGLNTCLQNMRNCSMRADAIAKLRAHYDALAGALADPAADADGLAAEAAQYKASMWEYCFSQRSASARALSSAYSRVLMLEGVDFPELVWRHQVKLGYGDKGQDFDDLEDAQKLEVYNSIIVESGRAKMQVRLLLSAKIAPTTLAQAVSVFIMAAGTLAWDVFTAEHNVETILRGSLNVLAAVGGFAVDVAVGAAVTKAVANVGLGLFATSLAGFVVGAVAGLIFIAASGALINLIIGSPRQVPPISELKFHTAVMPDGMALANAISHQ